jgi:hypothetical protein
LNSRYDNGMYHVMVIDVHYSVLSHNQKERQCDW